VAKNIGVVSTLEKLLGKKIKRQEKRIPRWQGPSARPCLLLIKQTQERYDDCRRLRYRIPDRQGRYHGKRQYTVYSRRPGRDRPAESAANVMEMALQRAGLRMNDISHIVGTGYGREQIPFVSSVASEISCHAKGAWHVMPSVRMVIDIGGQDAKATRLDDRRKCGPLYL
jgi:hypothetical protein